tara:strand:- start:167 stop:2767 length:2601 start_codon:yes stop_codon:yes gene_type:complete
MPTTVPALASEHDAFQNWDNATAVDIFYRFIMPRNTDDPQQANIKSKLPRWLYNSKRWDQKPEFTNIFDLEEFQKINIEALDVLESASILNLSIKPGDFLEQTDTSYNYSLKKKGKNIVASAHDISEEQKKTLGIEINKYNKDLKKLNKGLRDLRAALNDASNKEEIEVRIQAQEEEISTAEEYKNSLETQQQEGQIQQFNDNIQLKDVRTEQAHEFYSYYSFNPKNKNIARALGYSIDVEDFRELTEAEVTQKYPGITKDQILAERERIIQQEVENPVGVDRQEKKKTAFRTEENPEGHEYGEVEYTPKDIEEQNKRQKDMETWFRDYSLLTRAIITRDRKPGEPYKIELPEEEVKNLLLKQGKLRIAGSLNISQKKNIFIVKIKPREFAFDPYQYLENTLFGGAPKGDKKILGPIVITEGSGRKDNVMIKGEIPMSKKILSRLQRGSSSEYYSSMMKHIKLYLQNKGDVEKAEELIEDFDIEAYDELVEALDFINVFKTDGSLEEYFEYDKGYDSNYFQLSYTEIINMLKSGNDADIIRLNRELQLALDFYDEIWDKYSSLSTTESEEEEKEVEEKEIRETEAEEFTEEEEGIGEDDEDFDERDDEEINLDEKLQGLVAKYEKLPLYPYQARKNIEYLKLISSRLSILEEKDITSTSFIKLLREYINSSNMTDFGELTEEEFINIFKNIPSGEAFNKIEQSKIRQARNNITAHNKTLEQAFKNITGKETKELLENIDFNSLFAIALSNSNINSGFYRYGIRINKKAKDALNLKFNVRTEKITLSGKVQYIEEKKYSFTGRKKEGRKGTGYALQTDIHAKEAGAVGKIGPTGERQIRAGQAEDTSRKKFFKEIQRKYKEILEVVG